MHIEIFDGECYFENRTSDVSIDDGCVRSQISWQPFVTNRFMGGIKS